MTEIDCKYCSFLSKEALYPNEKHRMSQATLETDIRQLLESHRTPEVTVAWQGGGPRLSYCWSNVPSSWLPGGGSGGSPSSFFVATSVVFLVRLLRA
ncbi:hypothetical protein [Paraburkholderia sp. RAU2J]|uniref:hypothetical protein n=1 Tax=Paraburkholderia sp. RAU2J TaxID=1938810 RepID=UPI0018F6C9BC|nr:hypothetical protein [Paraburkholderia sp. RAU2J]